VSRDPRDHRYWEAGTLRMHQDLPLTQAESERLHRALIGLKGYLAAMQKFRQTNQPTADSFFVRATKENGGLLVARNRRPSPGCVI
jgi:hypothetical protein